MFGLNSLKALIKKSLNLAKMFQAIDLERMNKMVNDLDKYKEQLKHLRFVLLILLILTMVNTVLMTIILFKH
jgi:hypothetical protein